MKCPECEHENPEGAKFCNECGHKFEGTTAPAEPRPTLEAERKRVTALFSDLSGYTAMTAKLDPEEVKEITSRVFDQVREVVNKYEGFIERFAGDGVLALFGIPKAHEDDPIRAVHAAREIHELVESLSPQYQGRIGRPLSMHSGVNTGLAVTADVNPERGTHGVTGDAINVAARLSDLAQAREILVGPETYRACKNHFTFESLKPAKVKGKSEPIHVFKVRSAKVSAPQASTGRQVFSEMVGRDSELDKLELQVMKAINGEGSVVNVIGEAGIGKSRLIAELKKREVTKRVTLLEGRAISIGKNLSFHPIIDLLKQWARIAEDDSERAAFDKLEKAVKAVHPEEANEILPFVATLMGMKLRGKHAERVEGIEGEGLEKLILKNVRELVIKGSELRPTVVIMEDLHWADTSSLELLESLYRLAEKYRIAFINVFRPGYFDSDDGVVTQIGERLTVYYVEIQIQALDKTDSETLINNMLEIKGLPYSLKTQIVDRAGGNPFFIEEVVRSLVDEGAVIRKDGGFEVTEKIESVVIPPTINDVLMARIDRLEERTRELVKVASVIGRSFFDRIIKDVADSIGDVDDRLAYLKDVQLIRDRTRMQELEYLFKHALAQEAAYESTLIQQRKALHLKVAQSIEKLFQDRLHEFYGMLAYHYGKGEDLEKAEEYMTRAGEEALRSSASSEALNYFQEALKLYTNRCGEDADRGKLTSFQKNLGLAHFNRGQFSEAVRYFDEVLETGGLRPPQDKLRSLASATVDFLAIATLVYSPIPHKTRTVGPQEVEYLDLQGHKLFCIYLVDSRRFLVECLSFVRTILGLDLTRLPQGVRWASYSSSLFYISGTSFSLSQRLLAHAKRISKHQNRPGSIEIGLHTIALSFCAGSWDSVPDFAPTFVDHALRTGDLYTVVFYLVTHGYLEVERGRFQDVDEYTAALQEIAESYQYDYAEIVYQGLRSYGSLKQRAARDGLSHAENGIALCGKAMLKPRMLSLIGLKVIAETLLEDVESALSSVRQGESVLSELPMAQPVYVTSFTLGRLLTHILLMNDAVELGNQSDFPEHRRKVSRLARQAVRGSRKFAPYRTWILKLMGEYYWLIGKQRRAIKWWNRAIKEGERLGARPDLSRTYFEVGKRMLEPESKYKQLNGIDANGYLDKAGILFEEMGLEKDIEDLERVRMGM